MQLNYSTFLRYFTIAIVAASATYILYNKYFNTLKTGDELVAVEMITRNLADGSLVTLEKDTFLKIVDLKESRSAMFSGRAHFKISDDEDKSFTIETKSALIMTSGATFMLKSLDENSTEVFVETGSVNLYQNPDAFKGSNMMVGINAGETGELTVGTRGIRKRKIKDQNYLAWQTGNLTFDNVNMSEVVIILENTFGLRADFSNQSIRLCRLSAEFTFDSPDQLLRKITETLNIKYALNGDVVTFSGDGCR